MFYSFFSCNLLIVFIRKTVDDFLMLSGRSVGQGEHTPTYKNYFCSKAAASLA